MGLLTDPSISQKTKYSNKLITYNRGICFTLYLIGLIYFCFLADNNFNSSTYFSENALLPGLVYTDFNYDVINLAENLQNDLERERETHKNVMPYAWILAKMRRIGLETHTHNFTLNYPLGGGKIFKGKNVYGILRAPRIGSTESIVISVPYRTPESVHPEITHGLSLILAFADFARRQVYWAKDIIFLVTEQEQLGMQAWLQAYYGSDDNDNSILDSGSLNGRAGAIQAAINLELQSFSIDYINLKIEGLNGQLPNLDLHNLVQHLSHKQGVSTAYKLTSSKGKPGRTYEDKLFNLLSMIITQSNGVPTGNHGLFHKYGIEALTLEGYKKEEKLTSGQVKQKIYSLLKIIDGISRSLNNLLERFHQSYFFYLLVTEDRFVSIGDYMPVLGLMAGALLIKAFILWLSLNREPTNAIVDDQNDDEEDSSGKPECKNEQKFNFLQVGILLIVAHSLGVLTSYLPLSTSLDKYIHANGMSTQLGLFYIILSVSLFAIILPAFTTLNELENEILHIAVLLEVGTALIAVGMLNFSLGFLLSVGIVPFAIYVNPKQYVTAKSGLQKQLSRLNCLLFHPLCVVYCIVIALTAYSFHELSAENILKKAVKATMDAITYSVVDSMIYGNWMFNLISIIFFPVWILFWILLFPKTIVDKKVAKLKINWKENNTDKIKHPIAINH
uniref:GPI-anchor transamidase component GPAA1 n=1 Tax=Corethrella appendiculata TaxID=1370023 RepID=U5EPK2_9DIPT